jgi:parallel beta-helix repeat protein
MRVKVGNTTSEDREQIEFDVDGTGPTVTLADNSAGNVVVTLGNSGSMTVLPPSGDTTGAADQAAINALLAAGKSVQLLTGIYYVKDTALKLEDGTHLWGVSADFRDTTKGTVIQVVTPANFAGVPVVDANNTKFAGVHRISFVCAGGSNANTTWGISDFTDSAFQATFLTVEDCTFNYFGGECIALYGNVNYIMRNRADNCGSRFIHLKTSGGGLGNGSDNFVAFNAGGSPATSAGVCSAGEGIYLDQVSNNTIIGNAMYGMLVGISISASSSYNRVEGNRCEKNVTDGINVAGFGNTILGNHCFNNGWTSSACGVNVTGAGATENQIVGNYLFNNPSLSGGTNQLYGVLIQSSALSNQVTSNHVFNVVNMGVDVRSSTVNLIEGNFISTCGQYGIRLTTGANTNTVRGNTVYKCGQTTDNTYDGIRVESNSDNNFITGNSISRSGTNQQKYGINIASSDCDTNIVFANNCSSGGKTAGINNAGTGTQFNSNRRSTGSVAGQAVLVAGTVTVTTAEILAGDNVVLSRVVAGGTLGNLSLGTIVAGTSFVINSDNAADTSTVYWKIDH